MGLQSLDSEICSRAISLLRQRREAVYYFVMLRRQYMVQEDEGRLYHVMV